MVDGTLASYYVSVLWLNIITLVLTVIFANALIFKFLSLMYDVILKKNLKKYIIFAVTGSRDALNIWQIPYNTIWP